MDYETPHPHDLQNVGPLASSLSHLLPWGEGARNFNFPLQGERVSAMCRRVRGYFGCGFAALWYFGPNYAFGTGWRFPNSSRTRISFRQ